MRRLGMVFAGLVAVIVLLLWVQGVAAQDPGSLLEDAPLPGEARCGVTLEDGGPFGVQIGTPDAYASASVGWTFHYVDPNGGGAEPADWLGSTTHRTTVGCGQADYSGSGIDTQLHVAVIGSAATSETGTVNSVGDCVRVYAQTWAIQDLAYDNDRASICHHDDT